MGETALRLPSVPFPWSLAVHHQSLASTLRKNEAPEEEADLGLCCNQMWDACWQRFEPRKFDFKKFLFNYGMFQRFTRITNSLTIFTKQYMLIASA